MHAVHRIQAAGRLVLLLALAGCGRQEELRPDVVCLVIDTLRADHVGAYGYALETTPRIDAFSSGAVVFERAVAQCSWTKPSMASIFTSLYPSQHRATEEESSNRLAASLDTLPELFQRAGYRTVGFSENPHIGAATGFDQGFDQLRTARGFLGQRPWALAEATAWLEQQAEREGRAPFFLFVQVLDPHGPYEPTGAERRRFLGTKKTADDRVRAGRIGQLVKGKDPVVQLAASEIAYLEALYDAELWKTDAGVGRFLELFEAKADDTVILLTADHGEEFFEHGTLKHGYQLYEETVSVPLVLSFPGVEPRRVADVLAQHIDIAPTLLELARIPAPQHLLGQSLVGPARGEEGRSIPALTETSWREIEVRSVREGNWKLIVDLVKGTKELYDLGSDPRETNDLSSTKPDVVQRLEAHLGAALRPVPGVSVEGEVGERDPELEEHLRALGYLGK